MYKIDYMEQREKHEKAETHEKVLFSFKNQLEEATKVRDRWKVDAEKRKKDNRELQKALKKAEDKNKKLEKAQARARGRSVSQTDESEVEASYEQERDQNQVHMC